MSAAIVIFIVIVILAIALAEQAWEWARLGRMARDIEQQEEQS